MIHGGALSEAVRAISGVDQSAGVNSQGRKRNEFAAPARSRPRTPGWDSLRPCADQTHTERPAKHQHAGNHPAAAAQHPPALVAQKVFREQFNQGGEN